MRIRNSMIESLAERDIKGKYQKEGYFRIKYLSEMSLEGILEICDYKKKASSFMKRLFAGAEPNTNHSLIANLLEKRKISSLITTNYDECIEIAYQRLFNRALRPIKQGAELTTSNAPHLFKLHGSISDPRKKIINTLSQESKGLPFWKVECLSSLLSDRDVLFVGYSGYDFDICPLLLKMPIRNIYWCTKGSHNSSVSYEASAVIMKFGAKTLNIDLRDLFQSIARTVVLPYSPPPALEHSAATTRDIFNAFFNEEERHLWFIIMLNVIGLGKDARAQCEHILNNGSLKRRNLSRAKREYGVSMFHLGRYKSAGELYGEAVKIAKRYRNDPSFVASTILDEAEAERCYGNLSRYVALLCEAHSFINEDIHMTNVRTQYSGLLSLRIAQLFETLITNFDICQDQWIRKILASCVLPALSEAEKLFDADDNFFGKNHLKYRLGKIREDPSQFKELSRECTRLGYVVGKINSMRELSKVELKANRGDSALKWIVKSINLARRIYDVPGLAKGFELLGNMELVNINIAKAKKYLANSWKYYSIIEAQDVVRDFNYQRTRAKADSL